MLWIPRIPSWTLFLRKAISDATDSMMANIEKLCSNIKLKEKMLIFQDPLLGSQKLDYRDFITPGIICVAIFFLAMALTAESFISERAEGLLERSWIAGVTPFEILLSYILSQLMVMVIQVKKEAYLPNEGCPKEFLLVGRNNSGNSLCCVQH